MRVDLKYKFSAIRIRDSAKGFPSSLTLRSVSVKFRAIRARRFREESSLSGYRGARAHVKFLMSLFF